MRRGPTTDPRHKCPSHPGRRKSPYATALRYSCRPRRCRTSRSPCPRRCWRRPPPRARRPCGRIANIRRRLSKCDALACADALTQHVGIARRDNRARDPRTRARSRARSAPRAAADCNRARDAARIRQAALRKVEGRKPRLRKCRLNLDRQSVRRRDRRISPAIAWRDPDAKPDLPKKRPERFRRLLFRVPS